MGERRVLVIGSQCKALRHLPFVPNAAQDLADVLCHPELGGCEPALENGNALLLDPSLTELDEAVKAAVARASADEATLVVAFIGHGEYVGKDFYLLASDSTIPPSSRTGFLLTQRLLELLREYDRLDGLVLLVDACYAGLAAFQAGADWPQTIALAGGRFEVLAASDHRQAYDGCFTITLTDILRRGEPHLGENLRGPELIYRGLLSCDKQIPTWSGFGVGRPTRLGDEGLWLGRNPARPRGSLSPLVRTAAWGQVEQLTAWFQRTPQLDQLIDMLRVRRCVAMISPAGQGKSTLAAALARSELADNPVPPRFAHALVFATPASSTSDLARALTEQLTLTVDDFPRAARRFREQTTNTDWERLDLFHQQVLGPLRLLHPEQVVRIVIDGLDQLPTQTIPPVEAVLKLVCSDPALANVRLVVTTRPDTPLPPGMELLSLEQVDDRYVERYLQRRNVAVPAIPKLVERAAGNWLVARLLADLSLDAVLPLEQLPATLADAYRRELDRAGRADITLWEHQLRPVLAVLAAAGVGPVLPLALLSVASGRLGGSSQAARLRDVLVLLRGLVVRGNPGTRREHVGLFHSTLVDYLITDAELDIDQTAAHAALVHAIAELAPMDQHNPSDPLHRYAATAEAEHLWHIGRHEEAVASLNARELHVPVEDLARLVAWYPRVRKAFGASHPNTLTILYRLALYTSRAGRFTEALNLFREVLSAREQVLGPNHPDTLAARHEIALSIGETGDPAEALRLYRQVLADRERILGPDHPNTLFTLHEIAYYTGETGDIGEALRLYRQVLADRERILGPDEPSTLATRHEVAYYTSKTGDPADALARFLELLSDEERILGGDHPTTLATRGNIARLLGETGNPAEALRQYRQLLADVERVLGADHPHTEIIRRSMASLQNQLGETDS